MKKTLTALMLMAGCALASPVQFDTLTGTTVRGGFTMTDGVITGSTETPLYTGWTGTNNGQTRTIACSAVAITLDITAIQTALTNETLSAAPLVTFDSNNDVGVYLNADGGIGGLDKGNAVDDAVAFNTWTNNTTTFVNSEGHTCLTMVVVMHKTTGWGGDGGIMVYDANGGTVYSYAGLGYSGNSSVDRIVLNTNYITSALVCSEVPQTGSKAWAVALIPEPSTATLSLLALAGLAARRRRHE